MKTAGGGGEGSRRGGRRLLARPGRRTQVPLLLHHAVAATLTYGAKAGIPGVVYAGLGLWAFLLVLIATLLVRTLVAQAQGKICVPE